MKQAKNNTPDKLSPELEALSAYLKQDDDIELAILFGSMATDSYTAKSDVDLAIKKSRPLTEHQKITVIEQVALVMGRTVDLVDLSTAGEPLLGQIIKYGKRLSGLDAAYAELGLKHVYAQADFMPYLQRMLKERREEWLDQ